MNQVAVCPSRQELERLFQGQIPFPQVEQLAEHLEKCDRCVHTVQGLRVDDTLVEVIRKQAKAQGKPPDAILKNVMDRVRGLRIAAPPTVSALNTESGQAAADPEHYDFLAPAQGPGELGRLGTYRVLKVLGAGGMGVVFLAEDPQLERKVALKAMKPALAASATAKQRFVREARTTAAIKHDHIVTIHQVGEDRGVPFLAMEFLEGLSLDDYLKKGRKPNLGQILRLGREIARGLAAAHERDLIHRDIKPANIWLEAPQGRVKILDFGLARGGKDDTQLTQSGAIVGTPAYMSPEQASSEKVDPRTDLFSLGCVLYRLCTGQLPFKGDTTMAVLMSVMTDNPRPVRQINPAIPQELNDLVMRLLAKNPEERPTSARDVAAALQAIGGRKTGVVGTPAAADEAPTATAPAPRKRRHWLVVAALGLFLLAGGGLLVPQIIDQFKGKPTRVAEATPTTDDDPGKDDEAPGPDDGRPDDRPLPPGVDGEFIKAVQGLMPAKQVEAVIAELKKRNPGFRGKETHKIQGGAVIELQLMTIRIKDTSPVRALVSLQILGVTHIGATTRCELSDLSPLKGMRLTKLSFRGSKVSDLSPLTGMPLTYLNCSLSDVKELAPLEGMPLEDLWCTRTPVYDLSPLKGMPLKALHLAKTRVADLSPLRGMSLTVLNLEETRVTHLSPLQGMPLKQLYCAGAPVKHFSALKDLPIETLTCSYGEADLETLRSIKTLKRLNDKPTAELLGK